MAQLVVRNLEEEVKARLRRRAARNRRSMEEEARDILRNALNQEHRPGCGLGSEIAAMFGKAGLEKDIPELRGYGIVAPPFDR